MTRCKIFDLYLVFFSCMCWWYLRCQSHGSSTIPPRLLFSPHSRIHISKETRFYVTGRKTAFTVMCGRHFFVILSTLTNSSTLHYKKLKTSSIETVKNHVVIFVGQSRLFHRNSFFKTILVTLILT